MLVTFPHNIMLSRTSGDECAMLIRKRSSASNSSMRSCSSAASSSCVSMNTVSSFDSNDGGIVNTAANSIIHPMLQHGYHQQPQQPIVNMNNNIVTGADSTLLSTVTSVNAPINYYYTSSSSSCRINIDKEEMKKYFNAPQALAARMLNVSVSTLKRRYYEMYKSRWPYQRMSNSERRKSIWYFVNEEDEPEKYISSESMKTLLKAFEDPTVHITKVKPVKEKQPAQPQRQFLSYIPPSSETTKRYDDVNLAEISESTQIKGGSRQKYFLIGGKSSRRSRGNKY